MRGFVLRGYVHEGFCPEGFCPPGFVCTPQLSVLWIKLSRTYKNVGYFPKDVQLSFDEKHILEISFHFIGHTLQQTLGWY